MTRLAAPLAAALILCACDSDPIGPDPTGGSGGQKTGASVSSSSGTSETQGFESGVRLKARIVEGEDGSKQRVGFFDSTRGENCSWRSAADGTTRCLPDGNYALYFIDPQCTVPLYVRAPGDCAPMPSYLLVDAANGCAAPALHVFSVSSSGTPGAQVYMKTGTTCTDATVPQTSTMYQGTEVPLASFAKGVEAVEQ